MVLKMYKYYVAMFLFFTFSMELIAQVNYTLNDNSIKISYQNREINLFLKENPFISFYEKKYRIKEKLGSYKIKNRIINSSEDIKVENIQVNDKDELQIFLKFDFNKKEETALIIIDSQKENLFNLRLANISNQKINSLTFNINDEAQEIFGGGVQFTHCNLKGQYFPLIVEENGVGRGDKGSTFLANLVGAAGNEHTTYAPLPFFQTSNKTSYTLSAVDNHIWDVDFSDDRQLKFTLNCLEDRLINSRPSLEIQFDQPINLVSKKNIDPVNLKDWMYGYILGIQGGKQKVDSILKLLQTNNIKPSAVWIQDWVGKRKTNIGSRLQWDWHKNETQYPKMKPWIDSLHKNNIKVLGYINPYFVEGGLQAGEGIKNQYFVKDEKNDSYQFKAGGFNAYMIDLSNNKARDWMKNIIKKEMIATGFDGWMCDFGEWLPFYPNLKNDRELNHNNFPVEWLKLNLEAAQEMNLEDDLFIFNRSAYQGTQDMRNIMWLGDQLSNFGKNDGLASAVNSLNSASLSGFPITHSDIGGYTAIKIGSIKYLRNKEILKRWIEMEAFTPLFRSHEGLLPDDMEQIYSDKENMVFFKKFNDIHNELIPYFKTVNQEYLETGKPMIRHPFLMFPDDKNTFEIQYQFFVGNDLFVCPVVEKSTTEVTIYLPKGNWEHFFTKEIYNGNQHYTIDAPLGKPAVFWRK